MVGGRARLARAIPPFCAWAVAAARRQTNRDPRDSAPSTGSRRPHIVLHRTRAVSSTVASAAAPPHHPRSRRTCCRRSSAGCRHLRGPCCRLVAWWRVWGCPPCHSDVGVAAAAPGSVGVGRAHGVDSLAFFTWSASRRVPRPCPFLNGQRRRQSQGICNISGPAAVRTRSDASRARARPCRGGGPRRGEINPF